MGMGDAFNGYLGGIGAAYGQQQQPALYNAAVNQWQAYSNSASTYITTVTSDFGLSAPAKPSAKQPELEWLDRRIDEMRVKL